LRPVLVAAAASEEWAAATRWYEERRPGLGGEFHEAVVAALALIETHPEIGSLSAVRMATRELTLSRFPYKIVYRVRTDDLYVVAVAHAKRRPGYWRNRS
jgi:toxin ParE1/3/4